MRDCKIRIMLDEMASELNVLARDAGRVARQNPRTADFTRNILQRGLKEIIACFPVYRTYVDGAADPTEADRRDIDWAVATARRNEPDIDPSVFDFLHRLLTTDLVAQPRSGFSRQSVVRFAMRVQQYSGPVMAKGLEDTAFYRYNRFVALNEVGGHPDNFGVTLAAFHRANAQRAERWPHAMLGTSTHDTKRGEDTRARLAVLSEMPDDWARQVQTWSRMVRARRGDVEGTAPPDRNDEYLFYQLLIGAWPADLAGIEDPDPKKLRAFAERIEGAMVKSIREAKLHSTWASPNTAYEDAMQGFVRDALDVSRPNAFLSAFLPFQERVARLGVRNSLVQTALKLTVPGMPDIYQGAELWDLSLVDPDNRRPVDYGRRIELLEETAALLERDRCTAMLDMLENWPDGRVKLAVIASLLAYRRDNPMLFARGGYESLISTGSRADQICAFARCHEEDALVVAAGRFPVRCEAEPDWTGTEIPWPQAAGGETHWRDLFSGRVIERRGEGIRAAAVLGDMPVVVLAPARASFGGIKVEQRRARDRPVLREMPLDQLQAVLADHRAWLDTGGQSGKKADLSRAKLQGISLWSADLREADLSHANLQGANLDHARLCGANLRHAQMEAASLWQANLRDADLSYAGLQRAKLDHADLSDANLNHADLTGASLWGATLPGARLEHAIGITEEQLKNAHRV